MKHLHSVHSGAGTNLKVGTHVRREAPQPVFVVPLHFFGSANTISRSGERFCNDQNIV